MRIRRLEIVAGEITPLRRFYGELLGLSAVEGNDSVEFVVGRSVLAFHLQAGFEGSYHFAFNVVPGRLDAALQFVQSRGIQTLTDSDGSSLFLFGSWNATAFYFYDPAGNIVEFIERRDLQAPRAQTSGGELLAISEVGLAARNCHEFSTELKERLGLSEYREFGPTFVPLGDEDGLLIVVEEGRIWFPDTGVAAKILPVRAQLQMGGDSGEWVWWSSDEGWW